MKKERNLETWLIVLSPAILIIGFVMTIRWLNRLVKRKKIKEWEQLDDSFLKKMPSPVIQDRIMSTGLKKKN